uniref:Uncharacterized protein n=1 Tax=Anopheles culicifacies TaxID=139723 RepID=A0A182MRP4_9DIPT
MFRLDAKLQPQHGCFQPVRTGNVRFVPFHQPRIGGIIVDVPRQMDGRFGTARGTIHLHRITYLVPWLTAVDVRILVGQNWPMGRRKRGLTFHIIVALELDGVASDRMFGNSHLGQRDTVNEI